MSAPRAGVKRLAATRGPSGSREDRHDCDVRTLLVVLRPEADSRVLTGLRERSDPGTDRPSITFRYEVLRVWTQPPERFLRGGLGLLPLAPISAVTGSVLPGIMERMAQRLHARRARPLATKLGSVTCILLGLQYEPAFIQNLLQGVTGREESTTWQAIFREGEAKGARRVLLRQGERRFGPPDAATRAALENTQDLTQLEALNERSLTASRWEDLFQRSASRRRSTRRRNGS